LNLGLNWPKKADWKEKPMVSDILGTPLLILELFALCFTFFVAAVYHEAAGHKKASRRCLVLVVVAGVACLVIPKPEPLSTADAGATTAEIADPKSFVDGQVDRFLSGEPAEIVDVLRLFRDPTIIAWEVEQWAIRHNIPEENRAEVCKQMISQCLHATIQMQAPQQELAPTAVEGEIPSAVPAPHQ
jgi:hypothetical protein